MLSGINFRFCDNDDAVPFNMARFPLLANSDSELDTDVVYTQFHPTTNLYNFEKILNALTL